ncbi:hypothetical protein Taro_056611 [Colocasia esculenta]|uniref:Uncharacterized protein n=1 Tax=Colocasia esculenta TaxID=4460 RepID=A0A843XXY0_COLES|nr:hypothetical protein [Colocasia esculenta]
MADAIVGIPHGPHSEVMELERSPPRDVNSRPPTPPPAPRQTTAIDKTLSTVTNLSKLLPTGTVLAFQSLSPSFSNRGSCHTSNVYLTAVLIGICSLSCIFFSFTDSVVGLDGKLYHGIATWRGFYIFNYDGSDEEQDKVLKDMSRMRIRPVDFVHAFFSVLVFLTVTLSDASVQSCFFSDAGANAKELLINLPLGVGFLSTMVFMIFPTYRRGIGYSDLTPRVTPTADGTSPSTTT